jgi:hypothetical protein
MKNEKSKTTPIILLYELFHKILNKKNINIIVIVFALILNSLPVQSAACSVAWATGVYVGGDQCSKSGVNYEAKWWTRSSPPSSHWINLGACTANPITTDLASSIATNTATLNGTVVSDGGSSLTDRGFIYGVSSADVTSSTVGSLSGDCFQVNEGGITIASFSAGVTNLCKNTSLYYKAWYTNGSGSVYGAVLAFNTLNLTGTYTTVQSGPWSSASTWGGCAAPNPATSGDAIYVGHTVTRTGLTIAGGTDITVSSGGVLTITGTISMGYGGTNLTVDLGGELNTTNVTYTTDGVITSSGTFNVINNLTIQSNGTATFNGTTTIGGNAAASGPGDFDVTGGTFGVTGDLDCSADGIFTADGSVTVGGDWTVFGSGRASVGGTIDITGKFGVENSGYVLGTGIIAWGTKDINPANSGAYVACADASRHDDNAGTPSWPAPPANPWDLTSCVGGALPVELISFTTKVNQTAVEIVWVTGSEIDTDYFEVFASSDGKIWESVGVRDGMGNSNEINTYSITDTDILDNNIKYYKLKQVDLDGEFTFSEINLVTLNSKAAVLHAHDDGESIHIYYDGISGGLGLGIYDIHGAVVRLLGLTIEDDDTKHLSLKKEPLSPGIYFIQLQAGSQLYSCTLFVK